MNPPAPQIEPLADEPASCLSALADGDSSALSRACALWREDAQARATWHAYHLIGDVLRSEDLAVSPARDAAFLAVLRKRLADEPTVLAPEPAAVRRRHRWLAPTAVAAGFMAVAGVLVVTRLSTPADGPLLAGVAATPAPGPALSLTSNANSLVQRPAYPGHLIRDATLDAYLRAHRQALGGVPAAVPGGMPRSVETLAPIVPVTSSPAR